MYHHWWDIYHCNNENQGAMMKIGFFEIENWERAHLKKGFSRDKLFFSENRLNSINVKKFKDLEAVGVFIKSDLSKKVLDQLPKLKLITTMSTGYDHIDLNECKKRKIVVSNVPVYGENTVAEHTFALILGLSRKLVSCVERTKDGSFDLTGLRGFDVMGKTLGVVGGGNIGQHVVKMGKGFEMDVLVFDIQRDLKLANKMGFKYCSLEMLLKKSDIVTLHVPYNKHTHHLIDSKALAKMKKGSLLINTSRGGVVDTMALVRYLKNGKLLGAGLDVLEEEKALMEEAQLAKKKHWKHKDTRVLKADHALLKMNNVLITPHNAFNTTEALMRIINTTVENIKGFKKGKKVNLVK